MRASWWSPSEALLPKDSSAGLLAEAGWDLAAELTTEKKGGLMFFLEGEEIKLIRWPWNANRTNKSLNLKHYKDPNDNLKKKQKHHTEFLKRNSKKQNTIKKLKQYRNEMF